MLAKALLDATVEGIFVCFCLARQPETGQRHAGKADTEFLQRRAACDRLGQVFREFIELMVHDFPFILGDLSPRLRLFAFRPSMGCYPLQQEKRENLTGPKEFNRPG